MSSIDAEAVARSSQCGIALDAPTRNRRCGSEMEMCIYHMTTGIVMPIVSMRAKGASRLEC